MAEITAVKSWADHNRAWMELLVEKIRVWSCSALLSPCYNMWLWRQINYRKPCFKILQIFHFTCSKLQFGLSCKTFFSNLDASWFLVNFAKAQNIVKKWEGVPSTFLNYCCFSCERPMTCKNFANCDEILNWCIEKR